MVRRVYEFRTFQQGNGIYVSAYTMLNKYLEDHVSDTLISINVINENLIYAIIEL